MSAAAPRHFLDLWKLEGHELRAILEDAKARKAARRGWPKGRPDADRLDMGVITAGVAVAWIGFRHPDFDWRGGRPHLVALHEAIEARPSFSDTRPDQAIGPR